jgi:hypothetical protein
MGVLDEKAAGTRISVTAGALEHRPPVDALSTIEDAEPTRSWSPATTLSPDGKTGLNPFSPFYSPSPTRLSLDAQKSESRRGITPIDTAAAAYNADLEAGSTPPTSASSLGPSPLKGRAEKVENQNLHCAVWPSPRALRLKRKTMRREKARYMLCGWTAGMSGRTRALIKVAMAMLLVGAAVGVAIGISKAVGGGVWRSSEATNALLGHVSSR